MSVDTSLSSARGGDFKLILPRSGFLCWLFLASKSYVNESVSITIVLYVLANFCPWCSFHGGNRRSIHSGSTGRGAPEWTIYNPEEFSRYYRFRPFPVIRRATVIIVEMLLLGIGQTVEKDIQKRAARVSRFLDFTYRLGYLYILLLNEAIVFSSIKFLRRTVDSANLRLLMSRPC